MTLAEKLKLLRSLEGNLRGKDGPLTLSDVARLIGEEMDGSITVAYLSQLEAGKRQHMSQKSRELLSRFFKVHPGYLVSDPEGYHTELATFTQRETTIDEILRTAADDCRDSDAQLCEALRVLAEHGNTRDLFLLMAKLVENPEALEVLSATANRRRGSSKAGTRKEKEE